MKEKLKNNGRGKEGRCGGKGEEIDELKASVYEFWFVHSLKTGQQHL